jgi:hypothetical protein
MERTDACPDLDDVIYDKAATLARVQSLHPQVGPSAAP